MHPGGRHRPRRLERGRVRDDGPTSCVVDRTWELDVDDAAAKLAAFMAENGLTVVFGEWVGEDSITTDTMINGVSAPSSAAPAGSGLSGQAMTISCSGTTMQTQAEGSPFTLVWHVR